MNKSEKPKETETDYFFINVDYSLLKISYADIIYIEGLRDYIKIHLKNSKPVIARMNVGTMDEQLPSSQFIRVHKSYIVSKAFITAIRKNSVFMGELEIPVSFTYRDALIAITGRAEL